MVVASVIRRQPLFVVHFVLLHSVAVVFLNAINQKSLAGADSTDAITEFHFDAKHTLVLPSEFNADISCEGSSPFVIWWNISIHNDTSGFADLVTTSHIVTDVCFYRTSYTFDRPGSYEVAVLVENPVDHLIAHFSVEVLEPPSVNTTGLPPVPAFLPIVSIAIAGLSVFAILRAYFHRNPSTTTVEHANFEFFHPVLHPSADPAIVRIKTVALNAKEFVVSCVIDVVHKLRRIVCPRTQCDYELVDVKQKLTKSWEMNYQTAELTHVLPSA